MDNDFSGAFWLSVITLLLGSFTVCLKTLLASKCSNTEFCFGCLKIVRDTQVEEDIELATINRIIPPPPSIDNIV